MKNNILVSSLVLAGILFCGCENNTTSSEKYNTTMLEGNATMDEN